MKSVQNFIDELGGASEVAKVLDKATTTVASWKQRKSIPVEHWAELVEVARQRGVDGYDYEALVTIHTPERERIAS